MDIVEKLKKAHGLTDADFAKPRPVPTKWSQAFWDGAKQHKLLLKKCKACGHIDHPPYLYCTECQSDDHQWIEASGKATLYAFAINEYGVPYSFLADLPYVLALVDLPEGPRMISNIVQCDHAKLKNGMDLEVVFEDLDDEFTLPKWKPAGL